MTVGADTRGRIWALQSMPNAPLSAAIAEHLTTGRGRMAWRSADAIATQHVTVSREGLRALAGAMRLVIVRVLGDVLVLMLVRACAAELAALALAVAASS